MRCLEARTIQIRLVCDGNKPVERDLNTSLGESDHRAVYSSNPVLN